MPSSYTTSLRLTLPATGELSGTWGTTVNTGITELTDAAIAGYVSIAMTDADYTLTVANGLTDQARRMMLNMTGTLTAARNVICPTASKLYIIKNATTGGFAITLKTSAGTGISIPNGSSMLLMCNGTDVVDAITQFSNGAFTNLAYTGTLTGGTGVVALGTNQFYKDASGNVGIGTASPGAKLDVVGTAAISGAVTLSGGTANGIGYLNGSKVLTTGSALTFDGTTLFRNGANSVLATIISGVSKAVRIGMDSTGGYIEGVDNTGTGSYQPLFVGGSDLRFLTSATEAMRLTSTGLGIGTATPGAKLDIASGNLSLSGSAQRITGDMTNATFANRLAFQSNTVNGNTAVLAIPNGTATSSQFMAANAADPTNASLAQLAVIGSTDVRILSGATGTGTLLPMTFYTSGSERLRIDAAGNVGIGTTTPVSYGLSVAKGTGVTGGLRVISGTASAEVAYNDVAGWYLTNNSSTLPTMFWNNGLERMRIDAAGNLGLGVTPSAWGLGKAIEVNGLGNAVWGVSAGNMLIAANMYYSGDYKYATTTFATQYQQTSGQHRWFNAPSGTAGNTITFTQAMTLDASGRLLVGTTTAAGMLTVSAPASTGYGSFDAVSQGFATLTFKVNGTTLGYFGCANAMITGGSATQTGIRADGDLLFATGGGTERARITSGGDFGFGQIPTVRKFEINAIPNGVSQLNGLRLQMNGVSTSLTDLLLGTDSGGVPYTSLRTGNDGNGYMTFFTGAGPTERARITSGGDLLVGTTSAYRSGRLVVKAANATQTSTTANLQVSTTDAQGANIGGSIGMGGQVGGDETPFAYISGRKENSTSGNYAGYLAFATTNSSAGVAEAARIDSSGNLLVGTTARTSVERMSVVTSGDAQAALFKNDSATRDVQIVWNAATSGNNSFITFYTETSITSRGGITYNRAGGLVAYNTTSDYRAKDILGPLQNPGATIDALKVYEGQMKGATQSRPMLVAHEAQEHAPYAVSGEKDEVNEDGTPKFQQMDVSSLVPLLLAEIQSLRARVASLETQP